MLKKQAFNSTELFAEKKFFQQKVLAMYPRQEPFMVLWN